MQSTSSEEYSLGNISFRSEWERNVARLLNHLGIKWLYEPKRFYLTKELTYLPDFQLLSTNPWNCQWLEVKGLWHKGDKRKIMHFIRQNPNEKIHVLASREYKLVEKKYRSIVPGWLTYYQRKKKTKRKRTRVRRKK